MKEPASRFLRAARGLTVDATPVWFMRQAGRSLPEYRKIRESHSLIEITRTPQLSAEVTLQPVRRLGVDAAILFADISLPVIAMDSSMELVDGVGPVTRSPIRTAEAVARLRVPDPQESLGHVLETIRILKGELGELPLIGFAGAPFTLAAYLVEGGPSRDYFTTKTFMHSEPEVFSALMEKLTDTTLAYMNAQAEAGVDAIQLFDTWAGVLSPADYAAKVLPHSRRIMEGLAHHGIPRIHFATGASTLLEHLAGAGAEVVGVDWRLPIGEAYDRLSGTAAVQGNLDPSTVVAPSEVSLAAANQILEAVAGRPGHIFNLGHGVLPTTPPDNLARLVAEVHERSSRMVLSR